MPKISRAKLVNKAVEMVEGAMNTLSCPGLCIECGEEHEGCEPDLEDGLCDFCEQNTVYGAEQVLVCFG